MYNVCFKKIVTIWSVWRFFFETDVNWKYFNFWPFRIFLKINCVFIHLTKSFFCADAHFYHHPWKAYFLYTSFSILFVGTIYRFWCSIGVLHGIFAKSKRECWEKALSSTHCAFSSNLFHEKITQTYTDHLSSPEGIKFSPWKVFVTKPLSHCISFHQE